MGVGAGYGLGSSVCDFKDLLTASLKHFRSVRPSSHSLTFILALDRNARFGEWVLFIAGHCVNSRN